MSGFLRLLRVGLVKAIKIGDARFTPENIDNTGRNDLCPCGSGKKFKKCCGKGL